MPQNPIQLAISKRLKAKKSVINLSFADYTFYDSLLSNKKIQNSFVNIFKYPYYYPTAKGELAARQAISQYYKKFGQDISPEKILLTSSLNQSYLYLIKLFGTIGDSEISSRSAAHSAGQILAPRPHTAAFDEVAGFLNQKIKYFNLDSTNGWQIDLDSLKESLTPKTRAIFLMSPHLPTGAVQGPETLSALFDLIKGKNIAVIIDESLSDFIFNKKEFPITESLSSGNQLIISLQTLSNSFALPGFKLSWLTFHGPDKAVQSLYQSVEYLADTFLTLNQLSQTVLPEIIKHTEKWRYKFARQVEKNYRLAARLLRKVPQLKFHKPDGGFYCLLEATTGKKTDQDLVIDLLKQTGVYLHPGHYYGLNPESNYLVLCFLQDPRVLTSSLKKVAKYFKSKAPVGIKK